MEAEYPLNENSFKELLKISDRIKEEGKGKKFDCVVGVSGGKDSSYLLYLVKEKLKLRPLAVHYDNGFDSDTSVSNILRVCEKLDVELETKVADWEKFKDITRAFFLAGVSDPDTPTDVGIFKSMYEVVIKRRLNMYLMGIHLELRELNPWIGPYDGLYVKDINKNLESSLDKFDNFELKDLIKYNFINGIQTILPLNYIEYNQEKVIKILQENLIDKLWRTSP